MTKADLQPFLNKKVRVYLKTKTESGENTSFAGEITQISDEAIYLEFFRKGKKLNGGLIDISIIGSVFELSEQNQSEDILKEL